MYFFLLIVSFSWDLAHILRKNPASFLPQNILNILLVCSPKAILHLCWFCLYFTCSFSKARQTASITKYIMCSISSTNINWFALSYSYMQWGGHLSNLFYFPWSLLVRFTFALGLGKGAANKFQRCGRELGNQAEELRERRVCITPWKLEGTEWEV